MQPSKRYEAALRIARMCAKTCGADVVDQNYKVNIATMVVMFSVTVYFIFSIYTVQLKIHENWGVLLEAFCMVGSVLQGVTKLTTGIVYTKKLCSNAILLRSIYVKYETKGDGYIAALNKCISRVRFILKMAAYIYGVIIPSFIAVPLVMWAFTGHRLLAMQFYIPFLDPETTRGYILTIGMQSVCLLFGGFGNFAGDVFVFIFFGHISLFADILKLKTDELNETAKDFGNPMVMDMLLDLIQWHQTYSDFIKESDQTFFWINSVQITTSGVSIVFTLFIMLTGNWPGSYGYCCFLFSIMYMYCGLGTFVKVANEDIMDGIYAIHWYNMTVSQQKIVSLMLMKSQSSKEITVGGVVPMSVSTGLQVTKTIYSVFMMLLNFLS